MNRRAFVSSSFLVGTAAGVGAGSAGAVVGIERSRRDVKMSYSQQGEDLVLKSILDYLEVDRPTYLDIGAADPVRINNTYLFYLMGGHGVLVEPNPSLRRRLLAERPRDTVLSVGIGMGGETEADYYLVGGSLGGDLNTFSREQAESYAAKTGGLHSIAKVIKMPLVDINQVISKNFAGAPDILCIDTEGLDLDILKSLDFERFRPKVLCVETLIYGTKRVETRILDLVISKGYTIRGSTFVNTVFVDERKLG